MTDLRALILGADVADLEARLRPGGDTRGQRSLGTGVGVSPGVGSGQVYFDADDALDAADRGEPVVLVVASTGPGDEPAMRFSSAVVTARGGVASHAAVVARSWGIPAVCGVDGLVVDHASRSAAIGSIRLAEGDWVTVDGTSGQLTSGQVTVRQPIATLDELPDEHRRALAAASRVIGGKVDVWANADTPDEVVLARSFGATGIGLCRSEHRFWGDRAGALADFLTASTYKTCQDGANEFVGWTRSDVAELLQAAGDVPVTVRLLDAPTHEFASHAAEPEVNPMMGVRGVRFAVTRPDVYEAQVSGALQAVAVASAAGAHPQLRLLVPMVTGVGEVCLVQRLVGSAPVAVAAMIETPRAALCASQLASAVPILSFGTNDLTQLTFGMSRDDMANGLIERYVADGLLAADPFRTLDHDGVGRLIAQACVDAVAARPDVELAACGEHAADADSVAMLLRYGVTRLSVSPYRVPMAMIAAAASVLSQNRLD